MTLDDAIRASVRAALQTELPRLLAEELGRERLVPVESAGVSKRLLLDAGRRGELTIYRRGTAAFVTRDALDAWIMAAPVARTTPETDADDDVAEVLALNRKRGALG